MSNDPDTDEPGKPRRRWYQFSLRTLLVAVAVFCAVVGWGGSQFLIVRERREVLRLLGSTGEGMGVSSMAYGDPTNPPPTINWFRRILGDYPANVIIVPRRAYRAYRDPEVMRRAREAFPGAKIEEGDI
jgi:hypothetical protein